LVVEVYDLVTLGLQAWAQVEAPQVDHRDLVETQLGEVGFDGGAQLSGFLYGGQWDRAAVDETTGADPC
jgi:hypothetical protein